MDKKHVTRALGGLMLFGVAIELTGCGGSFDPGVRNVKLQSPEGDNLTKKIKNDAGAVVSEKRACVLREYYGGALAPQMFWTNADQSNAVFDCDDAEAPFTFGPVIKGPPKLVVALYGFNLGATGVASMTDAYGNYLYGSNYKPDTFSMSDFGNSWSASQGGSAFAAGGSSTATGGTGLGGTGLGGAGGIGLGGIGIGGQGGAGGSVKNTNTIGIGIDNTNNNSLNNTIGIGIDAGGCYGPGCTKPTAPPDGNNPRPTSALETKVDPIADATMNVKINTVITASTKEESAVAKRTVAFLRKKGHSVAMFNFV